MNSVVLKLPTSHVTDQQLFPQWSCSQTARLKNKNDIGWVFTYQNAEFLSSHSSTTMLKKQNIQSRTFGVKSFNWMTGRSLIAGPGYVASLHKRTD